MSEYLKDDFPPIKKITFHYFYPFEVSLVTIWNITHPFWCSRFKVWKTCSSVLFFEKSWEKLSMISKLWEANSVHCEKKHVSPKIFRESFINVNGFT